MLALGIFMVSAVRPGSFGGARIMAVDAMAPVLSLVNRPLVATSEYVRTVTGLADLQAENKNLREENARLRQWYRTAQLLQSQNRNLQNLLHLQLEPHHSFITARVIADSGNAYVKSLLVLAGRDQGVDKGQAVLAGEGVIGRVTEAGRRSARILLLNDINSRIPVFVEGKNYRAIMAGQNTDMPVLEHLPPEGELEDGMRVVTSGHGGIFPYGLPVGKLVQASEGQWSVKPFAEVNRVQFVRIVNSSRIPHLLESDLPSSR